MTVLYDKENSFAVFLYQNTLNEQDKTSNSLLFKPNPISTLYMHQPSAYHLNI